MVDDVGKISKQSLLGLGVFFGTGVLVGSLSTKSVSGAACGGDGPCDSPCSTTGGTTGDACGACAHSSHSSHSNSTHVNDLALSYANSVASAVHSHHSSHSNS